MVTKDGYGIAPLAQIPPTWSQVRCLNFGNIFTLTKRNLASSDHTARLWEMASGETVRQYNGHHKGKGIANDIRPIVPLIVCYSAAVCCALHDGAG